VLRFGLLLILSKKLEIAMRVVSVSVIVALLLIARTALSEGSKDKDIDKVQGTWLAESAELGGQAFPEDVRKTIRLTIKGDTYVVTLGKGPDRGNIKLDSSAKPKKIDVIGTDGPNKGKKFPAIYDVDGDTWTICYDLSGKTRPSEFKTKQGSQQFLVKYKREKESASK
jgi:uncharacterized protein (TIGR03067 family)